MKKISREALESELIKREAVELAADFKSFAIAAWDIVEPGTQFIPGVHVDAIAEHLQACAEGKIKRLLVNVPPRHSKSLLTSVLFNAWVWARDPTARFLTGSYALSLATVDAVRTRRIVESEWFQKRWPSVVLQEDQATKQFTQTTQMGHRQITSVGGTTTGLGGNFLQLDDPISAQQAESAVLRQQCLTWYRESFSTRANTTDTVRVVIMQRLHEQDLAGYILREEGNLWDHLLLPLEYHGGKKTTSIGWADPRMVDGDILWPKRYSTEEITAMKRTLGSVAWAGQMQQAPVPRGGATFKKQWLRFHYDEELGRPEPYVIQKEDGTFAEAPMKPLPKMDPDSRLASFDLAFKGGEDNDYVAGQVWARPVTERAQYYLLAQTHGQFDFVQTVQAIRALLDREPCNSVLVEDKANGAAVIASLKSEIPGLIPVNPQGGKESRANAISPLMEAGQIHLPHPAQAPWVEGLIEEMMSFPRGAHDDRVDAMTQAIARMRDRQPVLLDAEGFAAGGGLTRANPWSQI